MKIQQRQVKTRRKTHAFTSHDIAQPLSEAAGPNAMITAAAARANQSAKTKHIHKKIILVGKTNAADNNGDSQGTTTHNFLGWFWNTQCHAYVPLWTRRSALVRRC